MTFTLPSFTISEADRIRWARDAYNAQKAKIDDYRNIDPKSMNFYPMKAGKRFMIQNVHRDLYLMFYSVDSKFYWRPYDANHLNINENFLFTYDPSTKYLISIGKKNTNSSLGQVALYYNGTQGHPYDIIEAHINYNHRFEFAREGNSLYLKHIESGKYILPRKPRVEGGPDDSLQAIGSSDKMAPTDYQCTYQAVYEYTSCSFFSEADNARINIIYEGRGWKSAPHCTFKIEGERGTTIMGPSDDLKVNDIISLRGSTEMAEFLPGASLNSVSIESVSNWSSYPEFRISDTAIWNMKTVPTTFKVVSVMRADGTPQYEDGIVRSYDRIVLSRDGTTSKLTNDNGLLNEVQTGEPRWEIISQVSFRGQPIKYKDTVMLFFNGDSTKALTRNSNGQIHCTSDMYCTDPFYGIDNDALFDPEEFKIEPRHDPNMEPFFELPVKEFYKRYPLNMECVRRNHATSIRGEERSAWYNIYAPPGYASLGDFGFDFPRLNGTHAPWDWGYWEKSSSKHILSWPNTSPYRILFVALTNTTAPTVKALTDRGGWIMDGDLQDCNENERTFGNGKIAITEPRDDQSFFSMGYTFSKENGGWTVPEYLIQHYPDNLKAGARVRVYLLNKVFAQDILADGVQRVPGGNRMFDGGIPGTCNFEMDSTTYSSGFEDANEITKEPRKIYHMFNGSSDQAQGRPRKYYIIFPITKQLKCCRRQPGFQDQLECGTTTGNGYEGNTTFDFANRCRDTFFNFCKASSEQAFTSKDCSDFIINELSAKNNTDPLGTRAQNMETELLNFCKETDSTIQDPKLKYKNITKYPDLCSCYAPNDYLKIKRRELINEKFPLIANSQPKLKLINLSDTDAPFPCLLMPNCKLGARVKRNVTDTNEMTVIQPRTGGVTEEGCSGPVCIQNSQVAIKNATLINSPINVQQIIKGCNASYSTTCIDPVYGPVYTNPIEPLKYLRDPLPENTEATDTCFTETDCEFEPSLTDNNKPLIVSDSCVNGTRTITYKYRNKGALTDCKDAARDLTIKNFPGISGFLLPLEEQLEVNTTDKTIRVTSRCTDCITNPSISSTCMLDTTQKTWYKTITKTAPTQPTNGGAACTSANNASSVPVRIPCDENKDCVITQISDACTTTPGTATRTTKFRIDSKPSGNGKTCKRVAEDTTSTSSYSNRRPVPEPVNDELTVTSDCFNCTETFNNPACVYDATSKTWKVTKTSTITPSRFGGNTCTLVPRTLTEPCPTNRDCEVKTDVVDRCNTDSGVRTMKVDILKYSNGSGVSCEAKARQLMPEMTNINKVYDSYIGEGSCAAFKDCKLDETTYNDVCDEMKGARSITIDVLNETVGTGKKSCETVATEYVQGENPDIVIDEVSRDGNTVKITSTCSKRKFYMLIAIILVVIVLIVGGVLLL
jgi:hypothetical protein